ncbi:hypothetical protein M011DRAFT_469842 [Sporormia fimetaria CBS 119925]|uniref:TPR-like protein n=1 Tax=Sporormia fimetaria CBS 119925 TaxID=1340428 RepID=A0A6A6V3H9_9PLEO|nr:hypothetical protein M011DRAFT_469842 [Sporormia fimetaria CBS 119925]
MPAKDFSFLQDPSAYHALSGANVPAPFRNAPNVPPVSSPLDVLLKTGHFRLAAIAAARNIVQAPPGTDYNTLLHFLHLRLVCLCLISEHALAAHESKVLGDLNSAFYRHPLTDAHLVPWDLRLLVVRLAALGYGEWRKGIMGYYELAQECRQTIAKAQLDDEKELWRNRLRDCGVRVANILVEMGDLEAAGRHLASLAAPSNSTSSSDVSAEHQQQILYMEALVSLRVGDIHAARRCLSALSSLSSEESNTDLLEGTLTALLHLSTSSLLEATEAFESLYATHPTNGMIAQNLAVCYLYTGRIAETRTLLEALADRSTTFRSLVFNLCTVYELCTEKSKERKMDLAERLAVRKDQNGMAWEGALKDFKL